MVLILNPVQWLKLITVKLTGER